MNVFMIWFPWVALAAWAIFLLAFIIYLINDR